MSPREKNEYDSPQTPCGEERVRPFVEKIVEWINACHMLHAHTCVPPPPSQRRLEDVPSWLIDTQNHCIVQATPAHQYLTLSYVWPREIDLPDLCLTAGTLVKFRTAGFFEQTETHDKIPSVIKFAFGLTNVLGERYLWCDRYCIVQDDASMTEQVSKMDKIYGGSFMTIIMAADVPAYDSRAGPEWPTYESSQNQYDHYKDLTDSKWSQRGWTYQEQILCKRAAIFTKHGVFWDCQHCLWNGVNLLPEGEYVYRTLRAVLGLTLRSRWWPDFGLYTDLICLYNGREFTFPQDALPGISGILNTMKDSFPGGFICGLPAAFLDQALLWQPLGTGSRRKYRAVERTTDSLSTRSNNLPSWSWCGWQCTIDPQSLASGLSYMDDETSRQRSGNWRTNTLIHWRVSGHNNGQNESPLGMVSVNNPNEEECSLYGPLPEGWLRGSRNSSFPSHVSHVRDRGVHFKYPIPLNHDVSTQAALSNPPYLFCRTTTASLYPAAVLEPRPAEPVPQYEVDELTYAGIPQIGSPNRASAPLKIRASEHPLLDQKVEQGNPVLVLQQQNGAFAGLLRLMQRDDIPGGERLTVMAISTGSASVTEIDHQSFE